MGVFDDAIREHLELKRAKGADEDELKELEDEAFGQAARPGDPDFPGSTSEEALVEAESAEAAPSQAEGQAVEAEPGAPEESSVTAESAPAEEPVATQADEPVSEEAPVVDEPASEEAPALEESEPGQPATEPEPPSPFSTAEREAIADQPTVFFDQAPAELELGDLELDFDEEIEEVGGAVSEPLPGEEESLGVEEVVAEEPATEVAEPPHEVEPEPVPPVEPAPPEPEPAEPEPGGAGRVGRRALGARDQRFRPSDRGG